MTDYLINSLGYFVTAYQGGYFMIDAESVKNYATSWLQERVEK